MAALVVVDSSTPEQIQGWIDQVRKDVDPQVLTTLGEELVSEGHLPKAQYSKLATNGLQRGKLKGVLAGTGAHVHGIPCGAEWKVKADEWWETHGHIASNRFGDKLKHTAGGGMITEQVLNGQVLSQREGDTVVIDGKFPKLCEDLRNEDFAQVKAGIDPTASEFGKLFSRGALNFRTRGVTPKYGDSDYNRPKLDEAFKMYTQLLSGKHTEEALDKVYTRRQSARPANFSETFHAAITGFAKGKPVEDGLLAAMALLADCQVGELGSQGASVIVKALGAVLDVYDATLSCVGSTVSRLAADVIEVWDQADSRWEHWESVYGGTTGHGPLECAKKFVFPVLREWLQDYWKQLASAGPQFKLDERLDGALSLVSMRDKPELGSRLYEERAADTQRIHAQSPRKRPVRALEEKGEAGPGGQQSWKANLECSHCGKTGHVKDTCFLLHPERKRGTPEYRAANGQGRRDRGQRRGQQMSGQQMSEYGQRWNNVGAALEQRPQQQWQQQPQFGQRMPQQYAPPYQYGQQPVQQGMYPPAPAGPPPPNLYQQQLQQGGQAQDGGQQQQGQPNQQQNQQMRLPYVPPADRVCFSCNKTGHMMKDCPLKKEPR